MLVDVGSRDDEGFLNKMHDVRKRLTNAAGVTQDTHDCVLIQGAGTHAIESVLGSVVGNQQDVGSNHLLILSNGAYGERQKQMCDIFGIRYTSLDYSDDRAVSAEDLKKELDDNFASKGYTHVSMIHHETTAGVLNPLSEVCAVMDDFPEELPLIVDSMSAFGAYEVDLSGKHSAVKYLISSANKCMEGVPGFSFAVYCQKELAKLEGKTPRSLALDLYAQAQGLTTGIGQFRFTPPTQPILAYHQALVEWDEEGGWEGRGGRYKANYEVLKKGLEKNGFEFYVDEGDRGYIISTILSPAKHPNWDFQFMYDFLAERGYVIYPGKLSKADSFRLGTIGKVYPHDCEILILLLEDAFKQMGVPLPLTGDEM